VAMDNRGLKNFVHCVGSDIFIVNFDYSMILRFPLREWEKKKHYFKLPVSFNANEYDSPEFSFSKEKDEEGNERAIIIFKSSSSDKAFSYERKKICRLDNSGPDANDIRKLYEKLSKRALKETNGKNCLFDLSDEILPLMEDSLSHTEISVENSKLIIRQRNIYTGAIIEITKGADGKAARLNITTDALPKNLSPFAIKTKDFMSLFANNRALTFIPAEDFLLVRDQKGDFDGIMSFCSYDPIINLHKPKRKEDDDGRKEQKARPSKQAPDRPLKKAKRRRRDN